MSAAAEPETLLHFVSPKNAVWSRANAEEAIPGTVTPLNWTVFGTVAEIVLRYGFYQIGALSARELAVPKDTRERCVGIFFGRSAIKVDFLCEMGRRMPGTSAEALAMQIVGSTPPGLPKGNVIRRYPFIAVRLPWQWLTLKRRLEAVQRASSLQWWRTVVQGAPILELQAAKAQMRVAYQHFLDAHIANNVAIVAGVQPAFNALVKLIDSAQRPDLRADLMAGYGSHAEAAMVREMWAISRGRRTLADFLDQYGFHGPHEGEISGTIWREDPAPVKRLIDGYRRLGDDADPSRLEAEKIRLRAAAEQQLLAALPRSRRFAAALILRAANYFVPMRGIGKMVFLRALDAMRAIARRIGQLLAQQGALDCADDVFYLTYDELIGELPRNVRQLVTERRALVERYSHVSLPRWWQGEARPVDASADHGGDDCGDKSLVQGIGASAGVVEGLVEVVTDPDFGEVPDDRILVAPITDPSWVPLMYLSKALVVDIGGELSHAAVVARELGIPCVVGTGHGSRILRSGDYCRVDGTTGRIEILRRADPTASVTGD